MWSALATALPISVLAGFLVWVDAIHESYERGGRLLSPDRNPIENENVLCACLASMALLLLPAIASLIASMIRRHVWTFRAAIAALVLTIVMLFLDFLMLLSDTKGFSGLGIWASIFTTVHGVFIVLVCLLARSSRAVKVWSDIEG